MSGDHAQAALDIVLANNLPKKREEKKYRKANSNDGSYTEVVQNMAKLREELERKYIIQCERFPIEVADFIKAEHQENGEDYLVAAMKISERLKSHKKMLDEMRFEKPRYELPQTTLEMFCENNSVAISPIECVMRINNCEHGRVLRSVWKLLIGDYGKTKKHVSWLHGVANSGKSQFMRTIGKIFGSDKVSWWGIYLPVSPPRNRTDL